MFHLLNHFYQEVTKSLNSYSLPHTCYFGNSVILSMTIINFIFLFHHEMCTNYCLLYPQLAWLDTLDGIFVERAFQYTL